LYFVINGISRNIYKKEIMNEQQTADAIFNKFDEITCNHLDAKECSIVYVNGMIDELVTLKQPAYARSCFWRDVKKLIEKK